MRSGASASPRNVTNSRYRDPGLFDDPRGISPARGKVDGFKVPRRLIIPPFSGVSLTRLRILCTLRAEFADTRRREDYRNHVLMTGMKIG
jgi:hypothetical protein